VLLLQCLLHGGTCFLAYDLARRMFNRRTALIAGVVIALHPMLIRYIADLHLETLFTFLITLIAWLGYQFYLRPSVARGAALGAVAGLATLTKAVVIIYPGLLAIGFLLSMFRARQRGEDRAIPWAAGVTIFVVMGALIIPWTIRNYRVTGHFVPVSTGFSDAFLRGLIFSRTEFITLRQPPYVDAENQTNAYFRELCAQAGTEWEKNDWETDQILNREMKRRLFAEPGLMVRRFFVGIFTFWYEMTSLPNSLLAGGLALVAWVFALFGLRRAHAEKKPAWLLLLPVLYFNLLLAALLALGRYSVPILPELLILAAFGLEALLPKQAAGVEA
jgi:4-amino-4-deoxy-L-arabinose transferase-like glycosyltransferase